MTISVQSIEPDEYSKWNLLLKSDPLSTYRAGLSFAHTQKLNNRSVTTYIFSLNGEDIAGAHYSLKQYGKGVIRIADILQGVILNRTDQPEVLSYVISHFLNWAEEKQASYVRINPSLPAAVGRKEQPRAKLTENLLVSHGFKIVDKPLFSYWINLSLSEEEILKRMKPTARAKVNKALRSDIIVKTTDSPDHDTLKLFYRLYEKMMDSKGIKALSQERLRAEVEALFSDKIAIAITVLSDTIATNIAIVTNAGLSAYYHGALNALNKIERGSLSPGFITQYTAIRLMRENGYQYYDMALCPGEVPQKTHPQFDIWRFKHSFGGDFVEYMPVYGRVLKPLKGKLFHWYRYARVSKQR